MTLYLWLDVMMISLCILIAYAVGGIHAVTRRSMWLLLPLLILTGIFDNILTSLPIVTYVSDSILGLRIGTSPIEDFGYTLAAVILIPALSRRFYGKN